MPKEPAEEFMARMAKMKANYEAQFLHQSQWQVGAVTHPLPAAHTCVLSKRSGP